MNTPEKIVNLRLNEIVVVGTNKAGSHGGGLAREAVLKWGLLEGFYEGLIGRCYGFPTLQADFGKLPIEVLEEQRDVFYACVQANKDMIFFLTKIGCGIAGFKEEEIMPLFKDAPSNIIKPEGW